MNLFIYTQANQENDVDTLEQDANFNFGAVRTQPLPQRVGDPENLWFVVEKSGLDDTEMTGYVDNIEG